MIIRILDDGSVFKITTQSDEAQFMEVNPTGGFQIVDSLPPSASKKWKLIDGQIVSDPDADAEIAATMYQKEREAEYPPITDYLDGVVKGDQAQIDKYIADCQAVKAKYPKG